MSPNEKKPAASSLFEEMVRMAFDSRNPRPEIPEASTSEIELARGWLNSEANPTSFMERIAKPRQTLGIVYEVSKPEEQTHIRYFDQDGMEMGFVYQQNDPRFSSVRGGFRNGDVIICQFRAGLEYAQVKAVQFEADLEEQIQEKFLAMAARNKVVPLDQYLYDNK